MKILVDADSCSVTEIIESIASERKIPVYLYSDYNHNLQSEYSQVINVQAGKDATDYAVFSNCEKGDLVITQDIGLASLVLSKGAKAIHPCGRVYNEYTIDYINHQDLPEKDAKFKILQKHIKEYVQKFDKEFFASEQYDKEKSIKLNLEDIICDEELANIKCKTYFLKQTKHEIDIKEPKQKFPYSNKDDSVSSLINEEYSYRENNSNIDICETKISYAA